MKLLSNVKGDLIGGLTTSVISLPLAIAFGVLAFAPLGEGYVAQGALAGLYGVIVAGILTSVFGGTPGQISVPTAPMSVMVTSIIATLLQDPEVAATGDSQVTVILVLVSMTVLLAGVLQLLMAVSGGGKLIKFIPYPVIAGFMNGIAVIIILEQLKPFLGLSEHAKLSSIFTGEAGIHFETVIVGTITIVAMVVAQKWAKAIPQALVGLLCGVAAYFVIGAVFNPSLLQIEGNPAIIGPIPKAFPTPRQIGNFMSVRQFISLATLSKLLLPALTLSVLASIESLLTSVVTDILTRSKHNSTKELIGQGMGNSAAALFGGLPVTGSAVVTLVNVNTGGRTPLAGLVNSLGVLLVILFLGSLVQWIPIGVLAGILMVTAVGMIEYESISLSMKKSALENLLVILAVTIITVAVDLILAVLIGLIIAAFLFIKEQIGKTIVRRMYTGNLVHSKKIRSQPAMRILEEKGDLIKVYELNGSLFFGTCDKLQSEIESELGSFCIILDLKRVHTIDMTGAQLLRQVIDRVQENGNYFLLSYLDNPGDHDKERMRKHMEDLEVIKAVGPELIFQDTDHALEWAEDQLIQRELEAAQIEKQKMALKHFTVFRDLSEEQLEIVQRHTHPMRCKKAEIVFKEGDPGDKIYFIISGGVSVLASLSENGRDCRLATFGEGVFFGDMAILENQPRSATVRADVDTELLYLTVADFDDLVNNQPLLASKMLLGMARELSYRLRITTTEVRTLAE
ncbi:MAG: SulP family inorganic anion transporter [bacterium]